jgi:TIR domain
MSTKDILPLKLFYSYSSNDKVLRDRIDEHLQMLKHQNLIMSWHDRDIDAGLEWEREINEQIESSDVILILVSPSFLKSDFCYKRELTRALERHADGTAIVIPVLIKPVELDETPFKGLQALPRGGRPIASWENVDDALVDIARGLRKRIVAYARKMDRAGSTPRDRDEIEKLTRLTAQMRRRMTVQGRMLWVLAMILLPNLAAVWYFARLADRSSPVKLPDYGPRIAKIEEIVAHSAARPIPAIPAINLPDLERRIARIEAIAAEQSSYAWVMCDFSKYQFYSSKNIKQVVIIADQLKAGGKIPDFGVPSKVRVYLDEEKYKDYTILHGSRRRGDNSSNPITLSMEDKNINKNNKFFEIFLIGNYYDNDIGYFLVLDKTPNKIDVILNGGQK